LGEKLKTSVLGTFAATALLAAATAACSGPAEAPAENGPAESAAAVSAPAPSPTPTPTREPKAYTANDLSAILQQLEDSTGRKLSVLANSDLTEILDQTKALVSSIEVAPAECQQLAASSSIPSVDGAALALGQSTDAATGAATALSLAAGLDEATLGQVADQPAHFGKCTNMTMTVSGVDVAVSITPMEGVGGMSNTIAYRTDTMLPDGRVQSIITAQAVEQGVLLTAVASGGENEADDAWRAGALLDTAAALIG
jgi:TolA-binding protein